MKHIFLGSLLCGVACLPSFVQSKEEAQIRRLEQLELDAMQKGDTTTVLKLWDKNYVVNNPANHVVTIPQILGFIRKGQIDYSTAERIIEKVTFTENLAICMGKEIVTPQNATDNAGKKVVRRYTDVWVKTKDTWKEVARQATIVLVE